MFRPLLALMILCGLLVLGCGGDSPTGPAVTDPTAKLQGLWMGSAQKVTVATPLFQVSTRSMTALDCTIDFNQHNYALRMSFEDGTPWTYFYRAMGQWSQEGNQLVFTVDSVLHTQTTEVQPPEGPAIPISHRMEYHRGVDPESYSWRARFDFLINDTNLRLYYPSGELPEFEMDGASVITVDRP